MSNIAFVSHSYPTLQSPAQASFIKREAHLISQSHSVEIHLPSVFALPFQKQYFRSRNPLEENLPIHHFSYLSFPRRRLASITQLSLSKNLLRSLEIQKPDLVHLNWLYPSGLAAPSIKKSGYPVLLTIHGGDWYSNVGNNRMIRLLEKCLYACDKIICVGKQLKEDISCFAPMIKNKLIHIPHGIDSNRFQPSLQNKYEPPAPGWNFEKTNLLCVANFYREKGIDLLIKAFSEIPDKEHYHLHIVSAGGNPRIKSELDILINNLSLQGLVTFYRSQPHEQLAGFYRSADLLVSPSRKEGFGLVVAEAIACGTPVLATKSGGPEEIVTEETGKIVQSDNIEAINMGIQEMVSRLSKYRPETLQNHINTNFSLESKSKALDNIYRSVMKPT
ncbi:glycosyltransferase [Rhodohalobacter sp. 8-1]|uniref:glycosyltransferase n=1 Tax=Rhodohalobacter sp. 8-1 TaxID=3131972 RepID=UPI0030EECF7D